MADVRGQTVSVRIEADASDGRRTEFATAGTVITFRGFLLAYEEGRDDASDDAEEKVLPELHEGDTLSATALEPEGHSTSPPARFTEASLVKALEERGIGRPSTYAAIMGTILDLRLRAQAGPSARAGVPRVRGRRLARTPLPAARRLRVHSADGGRSRRDRLGRRGSHRLAARFYFGENGGAGLKQQVEGRLAEIDAREINTIELPGSDIVVRVGKYGPYLERGEDRQTLPPDIAPDELTPARAEEILALGNQEHELGTDPESGRTIALRSGRYGPYVTEVVEGDEKPRTASLFKSMTPETVTLDEALRLLTLPRTVGEVDGEEVLAANGRYGPYVKRGKESRSLESEEQLFTITLEEALAKLAEPKTRGRREAAPPLKELGDDPVSGKPIVLKEGRFGPYVTDGENNASLRAGDSIESITPERAAELIQARRERGPAKPAKKRATRKKS